MGIRLSIAKSLSDRTEALDQPLVRVVEGKQNDVRRAPRGCRVPSSHVSTPSTLPAEYRPDAKACPLGATMASSTALCSRITASRLGDLSFTRPRASPDLLRDRDPGLAGGRDLLAWWSVVLLSFLAGEPALMNDCFEYSGTTEHTEYTEDGRKRPHRRAAVGRRRIAGAGPGLHLHRFRAPQPGHGQLLQQCLPPQLFPASVDAPVSSGLCSSGTGSSASAGRTSIT